MVNPSINTKKNIKFVKEIAKIKNVNLKISAIKKENERITALNIKNKNSVISIKDSIFSKMNRSTNFMLNVNSLVSSEGYLQNN